MIIMLRIIAIGALFCAFYARLGGFGVNGLAIDEDDGFRRLLRRASAEADRPLLREQRRNRDDEDEDSIEASHESVVRKRREEEDHFYHTLLERAEQKRHEKRSFDTDDVDNKDAFGLREDWTGDSKISDADKSELENLFSTLNRNDEEKKDVTRSADEEDTVNQAASEYASWLLEQPQSKLSGALNHKLDVDHTLTKLLYEDKRDTGKQEKRHVKKAKKPIGGKRKDHVAAKEQNQAAPVAPVTPENKTVSVAQSGQNAQVPLVELNAPLAQAEGIVPAQQSQKTPDAAANQPESLPAEILPAPKSAPNSPEVSQNQTAPLVAPTPSSIQGNPIQNQTTPLVAPTPSPIQGNPIQNQASAPITDNTPDALINQTTSGAAVAKNESSPATEDLNSPKQPNAGLTNSDTLSPATNNITVDSETRTTPENSTSSSNDTLTTDSGSFKEFTNAENVTVANNCTTPECACQKSCYPKLVANNEPCTCQEQVSNATMEANSAKSITGQGPKLCTDDSPQCLCTRACYPKSFASLNPCSCEGDDKKGFASQPASAAPLVPQPIAAAPANATPLSNEAYQRSWCQSACHPYGVSSDTPCKCVKEGDPAVKSFPPRAPGFMPAPGPNPAAAVPQTANPVPAQVASPVAAQTVSPAAPQAASPVVAQATNPVAPQSSYPAAAAAQLQYPQYSGYQAAYQYPVASMNARVDSNPEVRTSVKLQDGVCEKSCFPHTMLSRTPCLCSNKTGVTVKKGSPAPLMKRIDTSSPYYQGCFKDMRPLRDLPKRFTRYRTTPETCVRECAYQNYKFAGVQYGYLCFCGNAFGRYGSLPDNDCNSECQGDLKRKCGGYYHNSVYSTDGKEYDPSEFDYAKIDVQEQKKDALQAAQLGVQSYYDNANTAAMGYPPLTSLATNYPGQPMAGVDSVHKSAQGANVATHLVKAAQAALTAAQKLLPSVSKKNKISYKGKKVKREDDEEDSQIMQNKMSVMASLGAVHDILRKTSFAPEKRDAEREKRSVSEDSDPFDPEDGKDLLTAYMANVAQYRRQTRSVDDDEEEEDDDKSRFEYRRMTIGDGDEGEFVQKYGQKAAKEKQKKRDILDFVPYKHIKSMPGKRAADKDLATETKKKRSISEGSGATPVRRRRSLEEGSGSFARKQRSVGESSGMNLRRRSIDEGSGLNLRKRRSMEEGSVLNLRKRRSIEEGSGVNLLKRRSMEEGSGLNLRKRRSVEASGFIPPLKKKRSLGEGSGLGMKKRDLSMADLPDGAVKMAARSGDVNDIEASLKALEYLAKRDEVPKETASEKEESDDAEGGENESGDSEDNDDDESSGSGDQGEEGDPEIDRLFEKRSLKEEDNTQENGKLKSDVDRGVDNLLNLVVELYKQQKTIRSFESSVRSLRDDIMKELNVPKYKKQYASKKVREEIEKTAKNRLHVLTSSIEKKIKQFAKKHPEASKQASLATSLLPHLPLSDDKYKIAKREISKRAAELDITEDSFSKNKVGEIPEILKEHFRRNAEDDVTADDAKRAKRNLVNGEEALPRSHRNVQESEMEVSEDDYDVLFH
ncbi:microtubule-associated protein futsch-like isoform X2 [Clytia hemisphaerica]|uniref:WSC domain-containing protein n=1 Tax=Clytia hemisphaerica TaxID=252671 RepID=A0A7M5USC9_9CNID